MTAQWPIANPGGGGSVRARWGGGSPGGPPPRIRQPDLVPIFRRGIAGFRGHAELPWVGSDHHGPMLLRREVVGSQRLSRPSGGDGREANIPEVASRFHHLRDPGDSL